MEHYLVLEAGLVYECPHKTPIRDGVVVVSEGLIKTVGKRASTQVPSTAKIVDCRGLTITAGFWNSHVHLLERKFAQASASLR